MFFVEGFFELFEMLLAISQYTFFRAYRCLCRQSCSYDEVVLMLAVESGNTNWSCCCAWKPVCLSDGRSLS